MIDKLADRLGLDSAATSLNRDALTSTLDAAADLVGAYASPRTPLEIVSLATLEVAAELWARRDAKGGIISTFTDGPAVRLARDPMAAAYPLLDPFRPVAFA